ncbi:shugoshin 2-like [Trichosurus vulpecula]|uniref:shugoshin 2-like n=1 Tax=Trichosurus vulpecula TaxID=9337 RepID=UPI00186B3829|nr:shugoshin 2-like [Trichosurus vulpecula]
MDVQVATDTSSKLREVREKMKEKRRGSLKTAKQNACLASKIKNKIINNSSIIKVSLKQTNKALALALNSEKVLSQSLIEDRKLLMKEIEEEMFENARLRRTIYYTNKVLRESEAYISAKLLCAIRESDPFTISEDISMENLFTEDNADKHRTSSPHGPTKSPLKDPTVDVENGKQLGVILKDLFLQQTKSPQTYHLGLEESSNSDRENKQVNAISILESEVADALSVRKDGKTGEPCYENKSPFGAHVTQRRKWASSPYLNCQTVAVNFEKDVCSNHFSRWTTGSGSPMREMNGQEASTFFWISDPHSDSKSNIPLLEEAIHSGQLQQEIMDKKNRTFSTNEQSRSVTTSTEEQNRITSCADKDVASPLRSVKCVFTEQQVQDTFGIHPIENSDNNTIKQSQGLVTLSPVEMDSLGENPTPISSGPPEDQHQVSDRIRKCRETYVWSEVCSNGQEKMAIPPSEKRRKTVLEKQIEVENQSPNCDSTCKSLCGSSGVKQLSQKNKVTDKKMFSNEINKEIKQIRNKMSTDLLNTPSKVNGYKEKNRKESEKIVINMDQQIPNPNSQDPQGLPCVRTLGVEMTDRPLKQERSKRTRDTKASDCREENMIPLESNLEHDSQEYIPRHKTKGRRVKQNKSLPRKACSLKSKMEAFNSDSKQSSMGDSPSRKKQGLKSHVGNSRIPILASCSVEPGLNNTYHASGKCIKDIQNNVNKKQTPSTVQDNATRNMSRSIAKAKQKIENVLSAKEQSDFGKKVVSGIVSGEHESTEVGQVMQNKVRNSLPKTERNFSQKATKKLVPSSSGF